MGIRGNGFGEQAKRARIVERLAASKAKAEETEQEAGRRAGEDWAANRAEYSELRAVGSLDLDVPAGSVLAAEALRRALDPELSKSPLNLIMDLTGDYERQTLDDDFALGFIRGAAEVWEDVESDL